MCKLAAGRCPRLPVLHKLNSTKPLRYSARHGVGRVSDLARSQELLANEIREVACAWRLQRASCSRSLLRLRGTFRRPHRRVRCLRRERRKRPRAWSWCRTSGVEHKEERGAGRLVGCRLGPHGWGLRGLGGSSAVPGGRDERRACGACRVSWPGVSYLVGPRGLQGRHRLLETFEDQQTSFQTANRRWRDCRPGAAGREHAATETPKAHGRNVWKFPNRALRRCGQALRGEGRPGQRGGGEHTAPVRCGRGKLLCVQDGSALNFAKRRKELGGSNRTGAVTRGLDAMGRRSPRRSRARRGQASREEVILPKAWRRGARRTGRRRPGKRTSSSGASGRREWGAGEPRSRQGRHRQAVRPGAEESGAGQAGRRGQVSCVKVGRPEGRATGPPDRAVHLKGKACPVGTTGRRRRKILSSSAA